MYNWLTWYLPAVTCMSILVLLASSICVFCIRRSQPSYANFHGRTMTTDWTSDWGWVGYPVQLYGTHKTGIVVSDTLTRYVLVRYDKGSKECWEQRTDLVVNGIGPSPR